MDESQVSSAGRKAGVRPNRLRGFHRAVKRGEEWALRIWRLRGNPMSYMLGLAYRSVDWDAELAKPNPLLSMVKKSEGWGGAMVVPFKFFTGLRKRGKYRKEKK